MVGVGKPEACVTWAQSKIYAPRNLSECGGRGTGYSQCMGQSVAIIRKDWYVHALCTVDKVDCECRVLVSGGKKELGKNAANSICSQFIIVGGAKA